jgi:MFS transporter, ACS family, hexuronate transporter
VWLWESHGKIAMTKSTSAVNVNGESLNDSSPSRYRWVIVGVLWLIHAVVSMNMSSLGILAPFIKQDLQLSSFRVGFLISVLSIGVSLSQMPVGLIADRMGVRLILTIATGLMGFFLALFSLTPTYAIGLAIILLYGGSNGLVLPAASKSILDWFPSVGRATAMGIKQTGVNFGGIFAGLLLPTLVVFLSWRQSLLAVGLVEAALAVVIYCLLRESPVRSEQSPPALDWGKIVRMAMHKDMLILGGVSFSFMASQLCFSVYLVLFLTQEMKFPIVEAGQYMALAFLAGAAGRILWSMASDYFFAGHRKAILLMIALILFFSSLALGMISFFPVFSPLLLTAVLGYGVSGIGWNAIYLTLVGESVGRESVALATGTGYFFGFMGSLVCPPLFGVLVDTTQRYGYAWFLPAFCAAAILLLLNFYREDKAPSVGR